MNDVRVMILFGTLGLGGSELKMVRVANHLADRGHSVCAAYVRPPVTIGRILDPQVPLTALHGGRGLSPGAIARLRNLLQRQRIDCVISLNLSAFLHARAAAMLNGKSPKHIALVNTSIHRSRKEEWAMRIYAPLLRGADRIVFGCDSQRRDWIDRYRLGQVQSVCIYNGVDAERFVPSSASARESLRSELGFSPQDIVLGGVGRLRPEKQYGDLLYAIAGFVDRVPRVCGLIVGDGPERGALESTAAELGISDRVAFVGSQGDVLPYLDTIDVFVLPSTSVETFSNATLEAMAMQRPVVVSDVGGAREMVTHGKEGFIYEGGNRVALAECLAMLLTDSRMRVSLGKRGREKIVQRFGFARMVSSYESLIRDVGFSATTVRAPRRTS